LWRGTLMRGFVTTAAVATALLTAIVGTGFGLQAAALGKPDLGQTLVVETIAGVLPYPTSNAQIAINGTRLTTRCRTRWIDRELRTIVHIAHGGEIEDVHNRVLDNSRQRFARFELAGCPSVLRQWLVTQLNSGTRIRVNRGVLDEMPVERLRFPGAALGLTVYISRSSRLPVALALRGPAVDGFARLHYTGLIAPKHKRWARGAASR
jgi:hypothetical protein